MGQKRGTGPGEFGLPHNLVVDAKGRVYVTDRDNQRVQVFEANGTFVTEWTGTGGVSGLAITKDQRIRTGGILRELDGTFVGKLSVTGAHGVAIADSGDVYLVQLSGIVQKFVKQSERGLTLVSRGMAQGAPRSGATYRILPGPSGIFSKTSRIATTRDAASTRWLRLFEAPVLSCVNVQRFSRPLHCSHSAAQGCRSHSLVFVGRRLTA